MATYSKDFSAKPCTFDRAQQARRQTPENLSTRVIDLSVAQLEDIITQAVNKTIEATQAPQRDEWAFGIGGLAKALGCSKSQAQKIKATGKYNSAIKQTGRKILVNVTQLRKLL